MRVNTGKYIHTIWSLQVISSNRARSSKVAYVSADTLHPKRRDVFRLVCSDEKLVVLMSFWQLYVLKGLIYIWEKIVLKYLCLSERKFLYVYYCHQCPYITPPIRGGSYMEREPNTSSYPFVTDLFNVTSMYQGLDSCIIKGGYVSSISTYLM